MLSFDGGKALLGFPNQVGVRLTLFHLDEFDELSLISQFVLEIGPGVDRALQGGPPFQSILGRVRIVPKTRPGGELV